MVRDDNEDGAGERGSNNEVTALLCDVRERSDIPLAHFRHDEISEPIFLRARRLLYVSHFFAQFSEMAWQFSVALFLASFTQYQSLVLVSTYGLTVSAAVCLGASSAGRYIESSSRLPMARQLIVGENLCVVLEKSDATCFYRRLTITMKRVYKVASQLEMGFEKGSNTSHWMSVL